MDVNRDVGLGSLGLDFSPQEGSFLSRSIAVPSLSAIPSYEQPKPQNLPQIFQILQKNPPYEK